MAQDLYDTGTNVKSADDAISLGSPGAGSYSNDREEPGEDTTGITLNVVPDPGLDPLTTGEFHVTDFALHQQQQIDLLTTIVKEHQKKISYKDHDYVRAVPIRSVTGIFRSNIGTLAGWNLREISGSTLTIDMYDGSDAGNGLYLGTIVLTANGSDKWWVMPRGIDFTQGIYLKFTGSGTAAGSLYFAENG